jgi:hypothetical protein
MGFNSPSATPMITMKFDKTRLDRLFKDAPKKLLVAAGTEIRTAARIFAAVAAKNTLPYGAYEQPPKAAVNTVQNQIKRTQVPIDSLGSMWQVLKDVDKGLAAAFWTAVKMKKMGLAKQILDDLQSAGGNFTHGAVSPDIHTKARTGKNKSVPTNHRPSHIITSAGKALNTYIGRKEKTIGAAKAGWIAAGKSIGGSISNREGVKAWYNTGRHSKAKGTHQLIRTETETFLKLTNQVPWADVAFPASRKKVTGMEFLPAFRKAVQKRKEKLAEAAFKRQGGR